MNEEIAELRAEIEKLRAALVGSMMGNVKAWSLDERGFPVIIESGVINRGDSRAHIWGILPAGGPNST